MQFPLPGNILAIFDLNACGENHPHVHFVASSTPKFLRITETKMDEQNDKSPTVAKPVENLEVKDAQVIFTNVWNELEAESALWRPVRPSNTPLA